MSSEAAANAVWLRNVLRGSLFSSALCETKLLQRLSTMDKTTHLRRQGGSGKEQLDSVLKLLTSISTKEEDSSSQLQALPVHLTTTERQNLLERVTEILGEWDNKLKAMTLAFPAKQLAQFILDRELINACGPCQGSKTTIIAAAALISAHLDVPCVVCVSDVNKNAVIVAEKLNSYFATLNAIMAGASSNSSSKPLRMEAVYVGSAAALQRQLAPGEAFERLQSGQTVLVIGHTRAQIFRVMERVVKATFKRPFWILDEGDKFFSSALQEEDEDAGKKRPIQREQAFYDLACCLEAPEDTAAAAAAAVPAELAHHRRFPALYTLMLVSATPIDMMAYCVALQLPVRVVMLDRGTMADNGYVGPDDLKPFEDDAGHQVFLDKCHVTAGTQYGLLKPLPRTMTDPDHNSDSDVAEPDALVLTCYRNIAATAAAAAAAAPAAAAGKQGLLVVDITNPRVKIKNNTEQRARKLASLHPNFLYLVIRGDGVHMVHKGSARSRVAAAAAAVAAAAAAAVSSPAAGEKRKRGEAADCLSSASSSSSRSSSLLVSSSDGNGSSGDGSSSGGDGGDSNGTIKPLGGSRARSQLVAGFTAAAKKQLREKLGKGSELDFQQEDMPIMESLQDVLARLDDFLDVPVVLIGYSMIRRSLSVRSAHRTMHTRVPTHIICAPSQGISLADVVQMMGRGMGNNRSVLHDNGHECVRVLAYQQDFEAVQLYYDFVEYLYTHRADGTLSSLIKTMENVPARFRSVLEHSRRQGQRGLQSGRILAKMTEFEETDQQRTRRLGVRVGERLSEMQHKTLLAIWHLSKRVKRQTLTTDDMKEHFDPDLRQYNIEGGHYSALRHLAEAGYVISVRRGVYKISEVSLQYVQRFAGDVHVAELLVEKWL